MELDRYQKRLDSLLGNEQTNLNLSSPREGPEVFRTAVSTGRTQFSVFCALEIVLALGPLVLRLIAADVGQKLKVAAVQFRPSLEIQRNCDRITAHLKRLAGEGVQVAVFPECALTGYEKNP